MSRSLTAQDRSSLIRLASSLPAGSAERKAILAGLSKSAGSKELDLLEGSELADYEEVTLRRVKRFKWQVFSLNGVVRKVVVHSVGLDGSKASFTENDARESGTTLANLIEFLENAGAKRVTRGLGPVAPEPSTGYDGWAW